MSGRVPSLCTPQVLAAHSYGFKNKTYSYTYLRPSDDLFTDTYLRLYICKNAGGLPCPSAARPLSVLNALG